MTAKEIMHPEDAKALQMLREIPFVDTVCRKILGIYQERLFKGENIAMNIRVTNRNMPEVYAAFQDVVKAVGIEEVPLYVYNDPMMNAYTLGETEPFVAVSSSMIERLGIVELKSVLAHECGHILCKHCLYNSVVVLLRQLGSLAGIVNGLVAGPILLALKYWSRRSELSADRCAAAVVGEKVFQRTMMKLAAGLADIDDDAQLIRQGREYQEFVGSSLWNTIQQNCRMAFYTHPQMCVRALEIDRWKESQAYRTLRSGDS